MQHILNDKIKNIRQRLLPVLKRMGFSLLLFMILTALSLGILLLYQYFHAPYPKLISGTWEMSFTVSGQTIPGHMVLKLDQDGCGYAVMEINGVENVGRFAAKLIPAHIDEKGNKIHDKLELQGFMSRISTQITLTVEQDKRALFRTYKLTEGTGKCSLRNFRLTGKKESRSLQVLYGFDPRLSTTYNGYYWYTNPLYSKAIYPSYDMRVTDYALYLEGGWHAADDSAQWIRFQNGMVQKYDSAQWSPLTDTDLLLNRISLDGAVWYITVLDECHFRLTRSDDPSVTLDYQRDWEDSDHHTLLAKE